MYKLLILAASAHLTFGQSLIELLNDTPQLSNLTTYLNRTSLLNQLNGLSNFTILAPNNTAFSHFMSSPEGSLLTLNDQESMQRLTALLSYHVLNATYLDFHDNEILHTRLTAPQFTNVTGGQVIQAFDKKHHQNVFYSGLLSTADGFNRSINVSHSAVSQAQLELSNPTSRTFINLPSLELSPASLLRILCIARSLTRSQFTGGNIFVIDQVLQLPLNISQTAIDFNLTSAVGALTQAKLVDTVDELADVTIFVPNNTAFQSIGSALSNLTTDQLTSILDYHIVNGTIGYSSALSNGTSLTTFQGTNLKITVDDNDQTFVNNALVITPDVLVANGVLHVIDNVLDPNNTAVTDVGSGDEDRGYPVFSGASSVTDTPFTSGVPTPTAVVPGSATAVGTQGTGAASSTSNPASPLKTGAVGIGALFIAALALHI